MGLLTGAIITIIVLVFVYEFFLKGNKFKIGKTEFDFTKKKEEKQTKEQRKEGLKQVGEMAEELFSFDTPKETGNSFVEDMLDPTEKKKPRLIKFPCGTSIQSDKDRVLCPVHGEKCK